MASSARQEIGHQSRRLLELAVGVLELPVGLLLRTQKFSLALGEFV